MYKIRERNGILLMCLPNQLIRQLRGDSSGDVVATLIFVETEMKMTIRLHNWDTIRWFIDVHWILHWFIYCHYRHKTFYLIYVYLIYWFLNYDWHRHWGEMHYVYWIVASTNVPLYYSELFIYPNHVIYWLDLSACNEMDTTMSTIFWHKDDKWDSNNTNVR